MIGVIFLTLFLFSSILYSQTKQTNISPQSSSNRTQGIQRNQPIENYKNNIGINEKCGTVQLEELLRKSNPERPSKEEFENWMKNARSTYKKSAGEKQSIITIPVVVHVIHNGEPVGTFPNISDEQVMSQIDVLNEDFRRLNTDAVNTPLDFLPVAADAEIEFAFATVDPDGNPTNGIDRYNGGKDAYDFSDMNNIRFNEVWHPDFYFNIWCVTLDAAIGLIGIANFPTLSGLPGMPNFRELTGSYIDGIIVVSGAFGRGENTPEWNLGRAGTHEVGHFLGLRHIGGDGDCSMDDYCADTPTQDGQNIHIEIDNCVYPFENDCDDGLGDLPDQFMNYMDYSDGACQNLFTSDQKERMQTVLANSPRRATLVTSQVDNGIPPDYPYTLPSQNDVCFGAIPVNCGDTIEGSTLEAFQDLNPEAAYVNAPGVWYQYTGTGTGVIASTCNQADYDTQIVVLTAEDCFDELKLVNGNDDSEDCPNHTSKVGFYGELGVNYYIYVNGFDGATGNFTLSLECLPPPENDLCENAIQIYSGDFIFGDNTFASSVGAPLIDCEIIDIHDNTLGNGIWYFFEGTGDMIQLSTCNYTNFDTKIDVFTGNCNNLSCLAGNDEGGCFNASKVNFFSEIGMVYYIYVSGYVPGLAFGEFELTVEKGTPPENDLCQNAIPINLGDIIDGDTSLASSIGAPLLDCDSDFPFDDTLGNGIWYTIDGTGETISLSTCNNADFDTKIDVFTGNCDDLVCLVGNDEGEGCFNTSELTFESEIGTTYYIYVSGYTNATGIFTLTAEAVVLPANDLCNNAIMLNCGETVFGDTKYATATGAPLYDCDPASYPFPVPFPFLDEMGRGIWYSIIGTGQDVLLSTCNSADFDTKIDVFKGNCFALECYAGNDQGSICFGGTSELQFSTTLGEVYYIYVSGFTSGAIENFGSFALSVECICVADAGECKTVYSGYEPNECVNLSVSIDCAIKPLNYLWSNGEITETISVCPEITTVYNVQVTDAFNNVYQDEVLVEVIDIDCDTGDDKVEICHKNKSLCVQIDDVLNHLNHGDTLGSCDTVVNCNDIPDIFISDIESPSWKIFPNPAENSINLDLKNYLGKNVDIKILDLSGNLLYHNGYYNLQKSSIRLDLSLSKFLNKGLYFVQLYSDGKLSVEKLVIK